MRSRGWTVARIAAAALVACGPDDEDPIDEPSCDEQDRIGDTCIGAPAQPVCQGETCTDGVECARVHEVSDGADLATAVADAAAGDCLALASGPYGSITLPVGVSLLGRSAADVSIEAVVVTGGVVTLRGLGVGSGGVRIEDAAQVLVEATQIVGPSDDALVLDAGATLTLVASTVRGAGAHGILAIDTGDVTIRRSIVEDSAGPGVWAECSAGCDCAAPPTISMDTSAIRRNGVVGVALAGVSAVLSDSEIRENPVADDFVSSGGLAAMRCSDLSATGLGVHSNAGFGVLIDGSTAVLGGVSSLNVTGNLIGVWIQESEIGEPASVEVLGAELVDNLGIGIGISGAAADVTIRGATIDSTRRVAMPVFDALGGAGVEEIGDGIDWLGGARVVIEDVELRDDARSAILIDGAADPTSSIRGLLLAGTDADLGIVQQGLPEGIEAVIAEGVEVTTFTERQVAIPRALVAPAN